MEKLSAFTPHGGHFSLQASVQASGARLHFRYELRDPEGEVVGGPRAGVYSKVPRADGLWQRTCFEAFFAEAGGGKGYWELNVAPDGSGWNLYRFEDYRFPQPPTPSEDFSLEKLTVNNGVLDCWLIARRATGPLEASLCAVVKTAAETHYLATAHAGGKADFHLRPSFCIKLAAITRGTSV